MLVPFVYLVACRLFSLALLLARGDRSKELELLVLRHELSILRRQARRPQLAESDRLVDLVEVPAPGTVSGPLIVRWPPHRQWPRSVAWAATIVLAAGLGDRSGHGRELQRIVHEVR